jgi:GTP-binding protein
MLVSNIDWSDYVGRIAIGKILSGSAVIGDAVWRLHSDRTPQRGKISKVFEYTALSTQETSEGVAGNIVGISGFEDVDIGETIGGNEEIEPIPFVEIDPPTVMMSFSVNDGPFAGLEGDRVTSREIRERLVREARTNISIKLEDTDNAVEFKVSARGAMQVAVVVEEMRKELELLIAVNSNKTADVMFVPHAPYGNRQGLNSPRSDKWLEFACQEEVLTMIGQLIGDNLALWGTTVFGKPAHNGKATPWHQDGQYWPIRPLATVTV